MNIATIAVLLAKVVAVPNNMAGQEIKSINDVKNKKNLLHY